MNDRFAERREAVAEARARRSLRRSLRVLILAAIVAGVAFLFQSPLLSVETIEVAGVSRSGTLDSLERFGIVPGEPLVFLDIDEARVAISEDPWVESVDLRRSWPTSVVVEVVERRPVAVIGGAMVAVEGAILPGEPDAGLPTVDVAADPVDGAYPQLEILGALEFFDALEVSVVGGASVVMGEDGLVASVAGYRVRLGRPVDMGEKARALMSVLAQQPPEGSEITLLAPERPAVLAPGAVPVDPQPEDEG